MVIVFSRWLRGALRAIPCHCFLKFRTAAALTFCLCTSQRQNGHKTARLLGVNAPPSVGDTIGTTST